MQSNTTPFPVGTNTSIRAVTTPFIALIVLCMTGILSSSVTWKRHVLAMAFLIYYFVVVVYGIHRANLTADELFEGELTDAERARRAGRAFQFHFSAWVTGAVTLVGAFFTAMMKDRWDMPVPVPYIQILSGMVWSVLSAASLQLLALYRRLAFREHRSSGLYALRGVALYGTAALLFPTYFFLYAGHGKHVTLPWLILFTLPTNFLLLWLVWWLFRRVRSMAAANAELLFGAHQRRRFLQLAKGFAAVMVVCIVVGIDYGRAFTRLWVFAVRSDSPGLFRTLRAFGAGQGRVDQYGYSPLHWSIQENSRDFARYAIAAGADKEKLNNFEQTPLMLAVLLDRREIARALVEAGADVNTSGYRGQTPLMLAARDGREELLDLLLSKKANVAPIDQFGESSLSYAVTSGHTSIVKKLLARGADTRIRTARFSAGGQTRSLLQAAREGGHEETVRALRAAGVR